MGLIKTLFNSINNYADQKTNVQLEIWCQVKHPALLDKHIYGLNPTNNRYECRYCGLPVKDGKGKDFYGDKNDS